MTNKEAIMILESIQPSCGEKYSFSESERYEAIDMAISALEAQNAMMHIELPEVSAKDVAGAIKELNHHQCVIAGSYLLEGKDTNVPSNDCISRQAALKTIGLIKSKRDKISVFSDDFDIISRIETMIAISNLPSAQPEIAHCKDCKWKQGAECVRFAEIRVFPNDFCSRAERRTDG